MNKTAIRNFAIWARNKLIADISYHAGLLGISINGITNALPQSTKDVEFYDIGTTEPYSIYKEEIQQRNRFVNIIKEKEKESNYEIAYNSVIEEIAYTWFNRLIAVRFMEVNDYLPEHVRVLSSESGKQEPDIVTTPFDAELSFNEKERQKIIQMKNENKLDEIFRILFIKQCRELSKILPGLFEKTNDYSELLLSLSFIDKEGVVYHLVNDISEDDFNVEKGGQVEIIGWLYQYYNSEPKNRIINVLKGTEISKEDIPAATQLFTTDWVVRYIVDNTVGRYWIERHPDSKLQDKLTYFIKPKDNELKYINEDIKPEEIDVLDNCMGSAHFLVYTMEVLVYIYEECGYEKRDAIRKILESNISGIDIDQRAYQIAYFAIMMKARQYDRRIFSREIAPKLYAIEESNSIQASSYRWMKDDQKRIADYLVNIYTDAKEYGSIICVEDNDYLEFIKICKNWIDAHDMTLSEYIMKQDLEKLILLAEQAMIMSHRYAAVVTNPPYMNRYNSKLKNYINVNYNDFSGDLFSVFIARNNDNCKNGGYTGFMTPYVWMFIKTYEKLRKKIINDKEIVSLIQMEYSAFEEATVPICAFILKNVKPETKGLYFRLTKFRGGMQVQEEKVREAIYAPQCDYLYEANQEIFKNIPGMPIAYWIGKNTLKSFMSTSVKDFFRVGHGILTGHDEGFIYYWYEVQYNDIGFSCATHSELLLKEYKYCPMAKGGEFRKWYGNLNLVLRYDDCGIKGMSKYPKYTPQNSDLYFKSGMTWTEITSGNLGARYLPLGCIFNHKGPSGFGKCEDDTFRLLGFMCSVVANYYGDIINPTITCSAGVVNKFPAINVEKWPIDIVKESVEISKNDWDSFETSWGFKRHPLI